MHVLLDVHVASNDQQSAVACSIASSHLHEVTSISSCVDLNSQSVVPSTVSQREHLCLEFRTATMVHSHQQVLPINFRLLGCKWCHPPFLNMDGSIATFGSRLAFVTMFFKMCSFITMFRLLFPLFPTFLFFQNFSSRALRYVMFSIDS